MQKDTSDSSKLTEQKNPCEVCGEESHVAVPKELGTLFYCREHYPNKKEPPEFPSKKFKEFSKQTG